MTAIFMIRRFFQIFVTEDFFKFWNGRKLVNFRPIDLLFFANILIFIAHWDCEGTKFRFLFLEKNIFFGGLHIFEGGLGGPPKSKKKIKKSLKGSQYINNKSQL